MSASEWPRSRSLATIRAWLTAAGDQRPSYAGISPSRVHRRSVPADTPTLSEASRSERPPLRVFTAALDIPDVSLLPIRTAPVALAPESDTRVQSRRRGLDEHEAPPPAGDTARCVGRWRSSRFRRRLANVLPSWPGQRFTRRPVACLGGL